MLVVKLSDRTAHRLFKYARSFGETPETVIEHLLDQVEEGTNLGDNLDLNLDVFREEGRLPEGAYWLPILEILVESGGSCRGRDVIDMLEDRLGSQLTPLDHGVLEMGEVRWRNRARFARLRMKERGLIGSDSPRGIWEITEEGRRYLNERPSFAPWRAASASAAS
ncbi:MAG TPA: winged helix-turn-helix domain-containing protein [Solirubrobacterales bacterium]|nr:winged helix-turn-helix domain-containing protein [Solirubrobacterales bacterium]